MRDATTNQTTRFQYLFAVLIQEVHFVRVFACIIPEPRKPQVGRRSDHFFVHVSVSWYTDIEWSFLCLIDSFDYDAVLVLLESPTVYPKVLLAENVDCFELNRDCSLQLLGWGKLDHNKGLADFLQRYSPPTLTREECREYHSAIPITENMLCAGRMPSGGIGSCSGDSGGPALVIKDGIYKQVGVISWSYGCADAHTPEVFTSIPSLYPWIMSYLDTKNSSPTYTMFWNKMGYPATCVFL